jgi:hypothetical protein
VKNIACKTRPVKAKSTPEAPNPSADLAHALACLQRAYWGLPPGKLARHVHRIQLSIPWDMRDDCPKCGAGCAIWSPELRARVCWLCTDSRQRYRTPGAPNPAAELAHAVVCLLRAYWGGVNADGSISLAINKQDSGKDAVSWPLEEAWRLVRRIRRAIPWVRAELKRREGWVRVELKRQKGGAR